MPAPRFVGRRPELSRLEAAVTTATSGRGALVLISGEAGVGKTSLAEHVLAKSGVRFLRGAALPSGSPYGPVTAALRHYLRLVPGGLAELGPPGPVADRATMFEAIRCALVTVAAAGPGAILLDDLHWSDEATLDLL